MPITIYNLGTINYDDAMTIMMAAHKERVADQIDDTIFVLEHTPVITRGRRMHDQPLALEGQIHTAGIDIRNADRGGLLTYHGPGQIVVYFILRVSNYFNGVSEMVKFLEDRLLFFLNDLGIDGKTVVDHPGIWVEAKKIASLGLRIADGVSRHGISLNISNDLSVYKLFDPCGLSGENMTNLQQVWQREIAGDEFWQLADKLGQLFKAKLLPLPSWDMGEPLVDIANRDALYDAMKSE